MAQISPEDAALEAEITRDGRQIEILARAAEDIQAPEMLEDARDICAERAAKIASRSPEFVHALEAERGLL